MRYLPDDNLNYPVLVQVDGGGSGSGFYFRTDKKLFLVTALHVLYEDRKGENFLRGNSLTLKSYGMSSGFEDPIVIGVNLLIVPIRKNDIKDIVLVEIADVKPDSDKSGLGKFIEGVKQLNISKGPFVVAPNTLLKQFKEVLISNEVFVIGYPSSLGNPGKPQIQFEKPLLRKGIIAGKNEANETIILDCPVYFGNSGGIVIEVEESLNPFTRKFWIIGVVSEYVPFIERLQSQLGYTNLSMENSGYSIVVPIDSIIELTTETSSIG